MEKTPKRSGGLKLWVRRQARRSPALKWLYHRYYGVIGRRANVSDSVMQDRWKRGLDHERIFWVEKLDPSLEDRFKLETTHLDPEMPLQSKFTELLDVPPGGVVKVLDVGAGPLTVVGKVWEGRTVEITAIDPLADDYNEMLTSFGHQPPVATQFGEAETLTEQFQKNTFDIVHSQNALDHSYQPIVGLKQCMELLKPCGWLVLRHFVNEAEERNYVGLHQWNFCAEGDELILWNPRDRFVVREHLPSVEQMRIKRIGRDIEVYIQKSMA